MTGTERTEIMEKNNILDKITGSRLDYYGAERNIHRAKLGDYRESDDDYRERIRVGGSIENLCDRKAAGVELGPLMIRGRSHRFSNILTNIALWLLKLARWELVQKK